MPERINTKTTFGIVGVYAVRKLKFVQPIFALGEANPVAAGGTTEESSTATHGTAQEAQALNITHGKAFALAARTQRREAIIFTGVEELRSANDGIIHLRRSWRTWAPSQAQSIHSTGLIRTEITKNPTAAGLQMRSSARTRGGERMSTQLSMAGACPFTGGPRNSDYPKIYHTADFDTDGRQKKRSLLQSLKIGRKMAGNMSPCLRPGRIQQI